MTVWTDLQSYYPAWADYRRWYLRVPGAQLAVRRHGELVLSTALGVADLDSGEALTERHLFRIASHSKTLTSVLVLRLVEQGRLRLDDPIASQVPELTGTRLADRTIGELLSHSGGVIRDGEDGDHWQFRHPFPDRATLLDVARADTGATLGRLEHFKYSNIAFGLLGLVLESVTGHDFATLVRTEIAEPLGLADLGGELEPARASEYAAGHTGVAVARRRTTLGHIDTRALAAATGAYATAQDLTAFYSQLLPGRDTLLSADSLRRQRHRQWEIEDGEEWLGSGLFVVRVAKTELFGHTGGYPGHITATFADEEDGWVVSALTNAVDGPATELALGFYRLRRLALAADHAVAGEDAERFTGRFASTWGVVDVVRLEERLFLLRPTDADPAPAMAPLEVVDDHTLRIVGGTGGNSYGELMPYELDDDGRVLSVRADSGLTMTPFEQPADG